MSVLSSFDWALFTSTFALIFVAELPDKTALATVVLATNHRPGAVFVGAAMAFVVQSAVAILFGSVFGFLPERLVHILSAGLFFVFAYSMWRQKVDDGPVQAPEVATRGAFGRSFVTSFMAVFVAEWGDLTQLATATLQAKYHAALTIFLAATLALWCVTALGVAVGHGAKHLLKPAVLQKLASVAMALVGCYLLLRG